MIQFQNTTFVKTVVDVSQRPSFPLPEVIFIGRSNVGKSSLINALTQTKNLAKVSTKPGKTRYLNYFNVDDTFYLVDAPGFGFTLKGKQELAQFAVMMEGYFQIAKPSLGLYLIDGRRGLKEEDIGFIHTLNQSMNILVVFTKMDKLNQSEKASLLKHIKAIGLSEKQAVFTAVDHAKSIQILRHTLQDFLSLKSSPNSV